MLIIIHFRIYHIWNMKRYSDQSKFARLLKSGRQKRGKKAGKKFSNVGKTKLKRPSGKFFRQQLVIETT